MRTAQAPPRHSAYIAQVSLGFAERGHFLVFSRTGCGAGYLSVPIISFMSVNDTAVAGVTTNRASGGQGVSSV